MADVQNFVRDRYPTYPFQAGVDGVARPANADPAQGARSLPEYIQRHTKAKQAFDNAYAQLRGMGKSDSSAQGTAATARRGVYIRLEVEARTGDLAPDPTTTAGRNLAVHKERVDLALIAQDVYFDQSVPGLLPTGTTRLSDAAVAQAFGIDPTLLRDEASGFFTAVYHDAGQDRYVVASRGSNELVDWTHSNLPNAAQLFSLQHEKAATLANAFNAGRQDKPVVLVGHSLGGSLASLQSLATGWKATSFNASSVEPATLRQHSLDATHASGQIDAFFVPGEAAAFVQDTLIVPKTPGQILYDMLVVPGDQPPYYDPVSTALGKRQALTPVSVGDNPGGSEPVRPGSALNNLSAAAQPLTSHYMSTVIESTFFEFDAAARLARGG